MAACFTPQPKPCKALTTCRIQSTQGYHQGIKCGAVTGALLATSNKTTGPEPVLRQARACTRVRGGMEQYNVGTTHTACMCCPHRRAQSNPLQSIRAYCSAVRCAARDKNAWKKHTRVQGVRTAASSKHCDTKSPENARTASQLATCMMWWANVVERVGLSRSMKVPPPLV